MEKLKVVLAGKFPTHTLEILSSLLPEEQFSVALVDTEEAYMSMTDADIIVLRVFRAPKEVMERNPKLKMILRWGAGYDTVDIAAAGARGILVTNTPGANAAAVSELAVLLMLAVYRNLLGHIHNLEKGVWSKTLFEDTSFCLKGKVVGLVGCGNIGRQVAAKVRAFGASVQYFDICRLPSEIEERLGLAFVPKEELLRSSDIVSLHLPLTEETFHCNGASEIARMKTGAVLINTARGPLVDNDALLAAVKAGKLGGAGLDVTEREPLTEDDPLLKTPKIIVTPHVGGATADLVEIIASMVAEDIRDFAAGRSVRHIVNAEYLSTRPA